MLFLTFRLGADRHAIEATEVVAVLPLVQAKHIPDAPLGVAGIFDYHGVSVPLIDLTELTLGKPSRGWMSTRIILVNYLRIFGKFLLGLLAEHATETLRRPEKDFEDSGLAVVGALYLGPLLRDTSGIVQRIETSGLLTESVCRNLFGEPVESL